MNTKNIILKTLLIVIIIGFTSCSSDSDSNDNNTNEITVSTSNFSVTIDENPTNGQVLGTVTGTTNQGSVVFTISNQTPEDAFKIDANTGELSVNNEILFDFEINPIITGTVKVINGNVSKDAIITININDVNESTIYKGNVVLQTQEEINDFGAHNYTEITGFLIIGNIFTSSISIVDLSPLSTLHTINSLYIYNAV